MKNKITIRRNRYLFSLALTLGMVYVFLNLLFDGDYVSKQTAMITPDNEPIITVLSHSTPEPAPKETKPTVKRPAVHEMKIKPVTNLIKVTKDPVVSKPQLSVPFIPLPPIPKPVGESKVVHADIQAQFPGGLDELKRWVIANSGEPEHISYLGRPVYIIVRFVVETDGTVSNIEILKDEVGMGHADFVKQRFAEMPEWTPGKRNGEYVRSYYIQRIKYTPR